jgi:NADPH2:quinone reductase
MNAAVVHSFDAPPTYTTFPDPTPAPDEALITITAAALHQIVRSSASGKHYTSRAQFPFIPGVDAAGLLARPVHDIPSNTRVYFGGTRFPFGTFAEHTVAPALIIPLPDGVEDALAAAIANPAMSSWMALDRARFTPGEGVLILGATGTSGQLAIQIAQSRGASHIVAAGRNPETLATLTSLGATRTISLTQSPSDLLADLTSAIADHNIRVVLDYLYGPVAETTLQAIANSRPKARIRYIQIGNLAGDTIPLAAHLLRSTDIELLGSGYGSADLRAIRAAISNFFTHISTHRPHFSYATSPLSEVTARWTEKETTTRLVFIP